MAPSGEIRFRPEAPARAANASRAVALALTLAGCGTSAEMPETPSMATSPVAPPSAASPSSIAIAPPPNGAAPAATPVPIDHSADASPELDVHRTHAHRHAPALVSGVGDIDQFASGGLSVSDMEPPSPSGMGGGSLPAEARVRGRVRVHADYAQIAVHGDGAPDPTVVGRTLLARRGAVEACYERELRANPTLRGRVTLDATLDANGNVRATPSQDTTGDANIAACFAAVLHSVHFAGATGGGFSITYTLAPEE